MLSSLMSVSAASHLKESMMIRKALLALAIGSAFAASMSNVYAEGDDEKKKPDAQVILSEGEEEKKPEARVILSEDDDKKKPEQPQLV
jgi:hypothetical protein